MDEIINADEFRDAARGVLPRAEFERIAAGAGAGRTVSKNRAFFERISFRPRMLVDVSQLGLETELFGEKMFAPILAGPTARHQRAGSDAELATAAGCAAAKAWMVLSERSSRAPREVASKTDQPWWVQVSPSEELSARLHEGIDAGAKAVVLTVDRAAPRLDADVHNLRSKGVPVASTSRPDAVGALAQAKSAGVPVLVKGVLSRAEATTALEAGADGLIVSNHGGRAVDGVPASIEALPEVAETAGGKVPVLVDGGFRRGSDILKALALGADAVLLGRPVLWALAAYGADGVQRMLELMQSELALAMGLSGTVGVDDAGPDLVKIRRW